MSDKTPHVLTPEERISFTTLSDDDINRLMTTDFHLTSNDRDFIHRHRKAENKLGVGVQLCLIRYPGHALINMESVPQRLVNLIADQLDLSPEAYSNYGQRFKTLYDHQQNIFNHYGFRLFSRKLDLIPAVRHLLPLAMENDKALLLVEEMMNWVRNKKLVSPPIGSIEKFVWHVQKIARWRTFRRLTVNVEDSDQNKLEKLLQVSEKLNRETPLFWLRRPTPKPSTDGMYHLINRMTFLQELHLPNRPNNVHPNRYRQLAQRGEHYKVQQMANLENSRERLALLIAHLNELHLSLTDQLIAMFDRWLNDLVRKGRNKQKRHLHLNVTQLNRDLNTLAKAMNAFLEAKDKGIDPFEFVFDIVDENTLIETVTSAGQYSRPSDMDYRDLVEHTYTRRRKAMLDMVRSLSFEAIQDKHAGLEALNHVLQLLDQHGKRIRKAEIVIEDEVLTAPLDHLARKRWKRHAITDDGINPNYYELAALDRLNEGLRSGDIAVVGSHRYQSFSDYLIPELEWNQLKRQDETRLSVSSDPYAYLEGCQEKIRSLFHQLSHAISSGNQHLSIQDDGSLKLEKLEKVTPVEVRALRRMIYSYIPQVEMGEVVADVDAWTNALGAFPHLGSGDPSTSHHRTLLMAALMASGMNIGPSKMAQACIFSERELLHTAEWYIREETLQRAIAILDNFVLHHPYSRH